MSNVTIIVDNVTRPEIFASAMQKEIHTVQVHRRNTYWNYQAVALAQADLSMPGYQLYMYLLRQNTNAP